MLTASNFPIGKIHRPVALPLWVGFFNAKCKIQNAKCKVQNAKFKMQNAKFKMQKCVSSKNKSEKLIG